MAGALREQPSCREANHDSHDRHRAPPMVPERSETVTALAPGPEHADEHKERAEQVPDAAHTAILEVGSEAARHRVVAGPTGA